MQDITTPTTSIMLPLNQNQTVDVKAPTNPTTSIMLPLTKICTSPEQPRRYFDQVALNSLQESIKTKGIIHPIVVCQVTQDSYELISGERRFRAAQNLGLLEVPAIIKYIDLEDAQEFALMENLQREDLNPIEETHAIVRLLKLKLKLSSTNEVEHLLQKLRKQAQRKQLSQTGLGQEAKTIFEVFDSIGKITWESFAASRLPLLNLPDDIRDAIAQGLIEYSKGMVIAKVKDDEARKKLLADALADNMTRDQIKDEIRARARVSPDDSVSEFAKIKLQYKSISPKLKLIADYPDMQLRLGTLLDEVHKLLASSIAISP